MKVDFKKLDRAFNPKVVAVVGDSKVSNYEWTRGQMGGKKKKVYGIHVNPESIKDLEALGVKTFSSLLEIPEPVDLAIICISRKATPAILDNLIRKDVAAAHFFTAGFAESDTEEGRRLSHILMEKSQKANFHLIGPNCMGLFNPAVGIKQSNDQYDGVAGPVGFISQSGSVAISFSLEAHLQGIDINKSVSYGNGIVLDSADFLDYFAQDPEIKVIAMYIEGVRNGDRFFAALKVAAVKKPVIIWKGGRTEEGGRAIASHTGSMAASQVIWEAAVRQCGALNAENMDDLIDMTKALIYLPEVFGNRMGIAGGPGGMSVTSTDIFAEAGLNVPVLTNESYAELDTFFEKVGGSYKNPIDSAGPVRRDMKRVMGIVAKDANIDNIFYIVSTKPGHNIGLEQLRGTLDILDMVKKTSKKPIVTTVFFHTADSQKVSREVMFKLQDMGIPAFPSVVRAAKALKHALDYYNSIRRREG
jgi:acyl-CoA synthetase (NDP forming)